MIQKIRSLGLVLMLFANILLAVPFLQFAASQTSTGTETQEVLLVSTSNSFPSASYVRAFRSLSLSTNIVYIEESSDAEILTHIRSAIESSRAQDIVLVAYDSACMPALRASLTQSKVSGVVLISPQLTGQEVITDFGISHPTIPVAIFDCKNIGSTGLYERLSGEDATLFKGLQDSSSSISEVYISPDANRYLSQWSLLGTTEVNRMMLPYVLQVQSKVAEFIQTYVQDGQNDKADPQSQVFFPYAAVCMGAAMLLGGLFLFYATIPAKRRENRNDMAEPTSETQESQDVRVLDKHTRAGDHAQFARVLVSGLFLLVGIAIYYLHFSFLRVLLLIWPVAYFGVSVPFVFPYSLRAKLFRKIFLPRAVLSCVAAVFLLFGIIMLKVLVSLSVSVTLFQDGYARLAVILVLFFAVLIHARNEELTLEERRHGFHPNQTLFEKMREAAIFFLPAIGYVVVSIIDRNPAHIAFSFAYLFALWASVLLYRIFTEISGAVWFSSGVLSLVYIIFVM